ncbi:penicillin-binding protein 1B [Pseudoteredinibacter isoporae]|uniref:penicillin-binding protein 1B n=1 Tax=Pseudoteredinibacter isoporae TaxID=570281 RepID=UPI00310350F9
MARKAKKAPAKPFFRRWWFKLFFFMALLFGVYLLYLDHTIRSKFDGRKWALPAKVYARPLELYLGQELKEDDLAFELKQLGYRSVKRLGQAGDMVHWGSDWQIYSRGFVFWDGDEAARKVRLKLQDGRITELQSLNGKPLDLLRLEPLEIAGIYPSHNEDRELLRLIDVPHLLGEALIVVEDRNFAHHFGISLKGIARAALANYKAGSAVQGGSTLTQQLVKNFYLNHERSLQRKAQEALMSVLLELRYSKSEILETYINEVYLGQSGKRGIHGFALASRHYFGQPLKELRLEQLALLVGMVKGASYYNPWRNSKRALERRNLVLTLMLQQQLISDQEFKRASKAGLGVIKAGSRPSQRYPAFLQLVKEQLKRDYQEEDLRSEGLRIFTSLSPSVQRQAERSLNRKSAFLERYYGMKKKSLQGAVVVTAVGSAEVLAFVGGRDSSAGGFNRALNARRPVGSLLKPAIYLTALNKSSEYSLASRISDATVKVKTPENSIWQPRNFDRKSHGDVMLYEALAKSYNQAAARLGMEVGLAEVFNTIHRLGIDRELPPVPSVLLGAVELSPLDVSAFYHSLANEGVHSPIRAIREVTSSGGQPLKRYPLQVEQRFSADSVYLTQFGLQAAMRIGSGRSAYRELPQDLEVAGKTGTTNDQRDSWFAGFSGSHLAVVWLGRDDNGTTPLTGSSGALRVWSDLFSKIPTQSLVAQPPLGVEYHWIDVASGKLSQAECPGAIELPFIAGQQPLEQLYCQPRQPQRRSWWERLFGRD